jgi:hypothetical protein
VAVVAVDMNALAVAVLVDYFTQPHKQFLAVLLTQ